MSWARGQAKPIPDKLLPLGCRVGKEWRPSNPIEKEQLERLPPGWHKHRTYEGKYYYRNLNTGTSHWKLPESFKKEEAKKDAQHCQHAA